MTSGVEPEVEPGRQGDGQRAQAGLHSSCSPALLEGFEQTRCTGVCVLNCFRDMFIKGEQTRAQPNDRKLQTGKEGELIPRQGRTRHRDTGRS